MASLRSIIQDGRFLQRTNCGMKVLKTFNLLAHTTYQRSRSSDTISVNAQSVWNDINPFRDREHFQESAERIVDFKRIPHPKPPYPEMWLETHIDLGNPPISWRVGAYTQRQEVQNNL